MSWLPNWSGDTEFGSAPPFDRFRVTSIIGVADEDGGLHTVERADGDVCRARSFDGINYSPYSHPYAAYIIQCCQGLTGNVDCDPNDGVDTSDLSRLVDFLYISFIPLCYETEANVDGQRGIDISDLWALVN